MNAAYYLLHDYIFVLSVDRTVAPFSSGAAAWREV